MKPVDIAIIVVVAVLFLAALGYIIYRKVKHKGSCDCGDCAACGQCSAAKNDKGCCCGKSEKEKTE